MYGTQERFPLDSRGSGSLKGADVVAEHTFTSGVPAPGSESVHVKLYIYGKSNPLQEESEVIVEKFEYLR